MDPLGDPYPMLARARRRGSVQAVSPFGPTTWATTAPGAYPVFHVLGYQDVLAVLRDNETYSSALLGDSMGPMFANTLITLDEPEHRLHRALVAPAFRPKILAHWQSGIIRQVIDELIDAFEPAGHADLVQDLTFAFPVRVITHILGLPEEDAPRFQRWAMQLINIFADWDQGISALEEFRNYFLPLVAQRRVERQEDLISELVMAGPGGLALDDEAVFSFIRLLLPAGIETTYRSLGNLLVGLLTHPDQLDAIREDSDLRTAAIEEGLRWEAPFLMVVRQSTRDSVVGGVRIPAGRILCAYVSAANHDEQRYKDPDTFDIRRTSAPHLAFGSGPHICLGMHLTRLETRVALDVLLDRFPRLRLDPTFPPPHITTSTVFRSPEALPVRFD
jgi:cytochrome P450